MSTLAGRRGMRPKMMMPFDAQPPQRKCVILNQGPGTLNLAPFLSVRILNNLCSLE